jgi:uncharacterized membrane protein
MASSCNHIAGICGVAMTLMLLELHIPRGPWPPMLKKNSKVGATIRT